ncbi:hypothetical protein [Lysobacter sp. A289]
MKIVMMILRLALIVGGACGAIIGLWAFIDPGAFPSLSDLGAISPPSARWRAAFVFLFSLLGLGFGSGVLRHRKLP